MKVAITFSGKSNVYEKITRVEFHGSTLALYSGDMLVKVELIRAQTVTIEE